MQYRPLGRTSEKVSVIGMGTWEMGETSSKEGWDEQVRVLKKGLEIGLTLIDTAEIYGRGKSEELVGDAIEGQKETAFVATKVSGNHLRYDDVISSCERSLQRLGIPSIDLYQIHWPNSNCPIKETMRAMERLVKDGKVRYIGISNFDAVQTKEAQESLSKEEIVSNQVEYSLTSRWIEDSLLPYCEKERITVVSYSPLARGKVPERRIPKELTEKYGLTPAQLMLNWVTHRESVITIPKSAQMEHLIENSQSLDKRLSPNDYDSLSRAFESE